MTPKINTFIIQEGKLKKPFRYITTIKGKEEKWINRDLKSDWFFIYKYVEDGTLFGIHQNPYGNIKDKLSHDECERFFEVGRALPSNIIK